jgi:hypothetical protein
MKMIESKTTAGSVLPHVESAPASGVETSTNGGLRIGWAEMDITPNGPTLLFGQYYERKSQSVQSPLVATAMAIEALDQRGKKDQAVMVSMDLAIVGEGITGRAAQRREIANSRF